MKKIVFASFISLIFVTCGSGVQSSNTVPQSTEDATSQKEVVVGAAQLDLLLPKIKGKNIGLVVNQTSVIGKTHLADTLSSLGVGLTKIFSPEHGFRGVADAGEHVDDGVDDRTGLPIVSLYGNNRKPSAMQLLDVDILVFDIQDVGARFFTYISTLHYLMDACAENNKKIIILDRPNPNGYVDGPVRQPEFKTFLGMHPIPVAHGLTIGELAQMINGEGWLEGGKKCEIEVIKMKSWKHDDFYSIKIKPSPNMPNDHAIALYPSTCLLEQTSISVGRGTQNPFEVLGSPYLKNMPYSFTPISIEGMAKNPTYENQICYGIDLRNEPAPRKVTLKYLIDMYKASPDKEKFFGQYFNNIAGNKELQEQIKLGMTEDDIRKTWQKDLDTYNQMRKKYLLYQ